MLLLKVLDYFFDGTFVSEAIQSWVPGNNYGSMLVLDILDIVADSLVLYSSFGTGILSNSTQRFRKCPLASTTY